MWLSRVSDWPLRLPICIWPSRRAVELSPFLYVQIKHQESLVKHGAVCEGDQKNCRITQGAIGEAGLLRLKCSIFKNNAEAYVAPASLLLGERHADDGKMANCLIEERAALPTLRSWLFSRRWFYTCCGHRHYDGIAVVRSMSKT
jgi:hypothetical protein